MEKITAKYETVFIVSPALDEEADKAVVEKFTSLIAANGEISKIDDWGKRKLAYPIEDFTEGHYVLVEFASGTDFPSELERIFGITDGILRSLVIRK